MNRGFRSGFRAADTATGPSRVPVIAATSLLAATVAVSMLAAGPASGGEGPPGSGVWVEGTDGYIDAFQALNSSDTVESHKDGDDFVRFSEALSPATLSGVEGTADAFASQASTVVTPSFTPPFDAEGIATSGRLHIETHKNDNGAPGVPVAYATGDFDSGFESTEAVPVELAGYLRAANTDADDCTQLTVEFYDGTSVRTFEAAAGGACTPGIDQQESFQVNEVLPAGAEGEIEVEYSTSMAAEAPGSTESANAAVEVTLSFYPPDTRITSARIRPRSGKASFRFEAEGNAKRMQCALTRKGKKPRFRGCRSPKTYRGLKPGRYEFQVRAIGPLAPEATPAKKAFRIR